MNEPAQDAGPGQALQVRARLAAPPGDQLPDPEAPSHERVEIHTTDDEVAPRLGPG